MILYEHDKRRFVLSVFVLHWVEACMKINEVNQGQREHLPILVAFSNIQVFLLWYLPICGLIIQRKTFRKIQLNIRHTYSEIVLDRWHAYREIVLDMKCIHSESSLSIMTSFNLFVKIFHSRGLDVILLNYWYMYRWKRDRLCLSVTNHTTAGSHILYDIDW